MTEAQSSASGPLAGVRVLDLTRVLAGPFATMILADLGAEIVKVESLNGDGVRQVGPFYDREMSHYFLAINRGKRSIAVDLKSEAGRDLVLQLTGSSDVVIENFRPDVMDRLGLGFEALRARKKDLVLCSISGFGRSGPLRDHPSFDLVTQARSGSMSITGEADGPPTKMGIPMGDLGGGLWGAIAVLAALHRRDRTGEPQHIDLSLLDGLVGLLGYLGQLTMLTGEAPERVGSDHHSIVPYGRFEAADGHIVLALHVGNFWRRFCESIDRPEFIDDPRFRTTADRQRHRDVLVPMLEDIIRTKSRAEWEKIMVDADIPHAPVLDVKEALNQAQLQQRGIFRKLTGDQFDDVSVVGTPVRFVGETAPTAVSPPPALGEHTFQICREVLGWDDDRIAALITKGILAAPPPPRPRTERGQ